MPLVNASRKTFTSTTATETSVDGILDDFNVTVADLEFLNPGTDLTNLVDGTPVCVVGTSEGTAIGTRPGNLVQYQTSPGADTCMNIVKFAQPPVSIQTFQELNANLNCQTLDFRVGTVFLPNGTTVGNSSDSSSTTRQSLRSSTTAANDQDCIVG